MHIDVHMQKEIRLVRKIVEALEQLQAQYPGVVSARVAAQAERVAQQSRKDALGSIAEVREGRYLGTFLFEDLDQYGVCPSQEVRTLLQELRAEYRCAMESGAVS